MHASIQDATFAYGGLEVFRDGSEVLAIDELSVVGCQLMAGSSRLTVHSSS